MRKWHPIAINNRLILVLLDPGSSLRSSGTTSGLIFAIALKNSKDDREGTDFVRNKKPWTVCPPLEKPTSSVNYFIYLKNKIYILIYIKI